MADTYLNIPELKALRTAERIIRIPSGVDIPITKRIASLIDSPEFLRLRKISQLGLVALVYPGATHSRFEHSLGVYRNALLFLERLAQTEEFRSRCSEQDCLLFLVAALFHDVGHYPFAHAIEDMRLPGVVRHELLAAECFEQPKLRTLIENDFQLEIADLNALLNPSSTKPSTVNRFPLLASMLSGPIDIDKMDYLERDSMHAGVPYGHNFDQSRLIGQLCVDTERNSLAITHKATTAAEMMVFARYVMFREVYWHHAIRSATSMLQRCIFDLDDPVQFLNYHRHLSDDQMEMKLCSALEGTSCESMIEGLFGTNRSLYKRGAEISVLESTSIHSAVARRPYAEMVKLSIELTKLVAKSSGLPLMPTDILIDAPPSKLEVQFDVRVRQGDGKFRPLGELSPVVQTLATNQFDNIVKRVRVFVAPHCHAALCGFDFAKAMSKLLN